MKWLLLSLILVLFSCEHSLPEVDAQTSLRNCEEHHETMFSVTQFDEYNCYVLDIITERPEDGRICGMTVYAENITQDTVVFNWDFNGPNIKILPHILGIDLCIPITNCLNADDYYMSIEWTECSPQGECVFFEDYTLNQCEEIEGEELVTEAYCISC